MPWRIASRKHLRRTEINWKLASSCLQSNDNIATNTAAFTACVMLSSPLPLSNQLSVHQHTAKTLGTNKIADWTIASSTSGCFPNLCSRSWAIQWPHLDWSRLSQNETHNTHMGHTQDVSLAVHVLCSISTNLSLLIQWRGAEKDKSKTSDAVSSSAILTDVQVDGRPGRHQFATMAFLRHRAT